MITIQQVQSDKYHFYRAARIPADIALDLAQRFAQVFATKRNAESGFDRIGEQDEKQALWAREWAGKYADKVETETAQINALTRVEVEEEYQN